ncbi:MAG: hypothetical protein OXG15_11775 [Gammaproteobacteria bacterium]|nr:hypothetical protein [Gammaproteobacteria bacterium]
MPKIYKLEPSKITPSKYISFFVLRDAGNLLFPCVSSSSTFESSWQEIHDHGGVSKQLLGDMHFATKHNDQLFEEFGALTCCSVEEEADVRRKVKNVKAFTFERHEVAPGVIAIPTPGHRPGAVSYLVDVGSSNVLFAGDSLWHDREKWMALSNKKNRPVMKNTLASLREESFATIFVNSSVQNPIYSIDFTNDAAKNEFLDGLAESL